MKGKWRRALAGVLTVILLFSGLSGSGLEAVHATEQEKGVLLNIEEDVNDNLNGGIAAKEANTTDSAGKTDTTDSTENADKIDSTDKSDSTDKTDKTDSTEGTDETEKTGSTENADKTDSTDETESTDKSDSADKTENADKTDSTDETESTDKSDSADKTESADKTDNTGSTGQADNTEDIDNTDNADEETVSDNKVTLSANEIFALLENSVSENSLSQNRIKRRSGNEEGLLAYYTFSDLGSADADTEIIDESGSGNEAYIRGNGAALRIGSLELPGGSSGSDAAYVELPTGLFDGQDTLTISAWLQNNTGSGDFSAMYFGTEAGSNGFPPQYWILNPSKNGYFKSVITDDYNEEQPYNTETACSSTTTTAGWSMYTTVITENEIIGYLNGEEVCRDDKTTQISDFGTDLVSYIGKSAYPDKSFAGAVKEVKIYTKDLSENDIQDLYEEIVNDTTSKKEIVAKKGSYYEGVPTRKVVLEEGESKSLPDSTTVTFSDGSTQKAAISWKNAQTGEVVEDTADLTAGTYTLQGELHYFKSPFIEERADPCVVYDADEDCYYFTSSWPAYGNMNSGYDRIAVRKADTLEGLSEAEDHVIWTKHTSGEQMYHIWAPELHKINGKWYIYYAASTSGNGWGIRCFVLECGEGMDITEASSWSEKVKFTDKDGGDNGFNDMCLDMTYFEKDGKGYAIWAYKTNGISMLKMAEVDQDAPWKLAGDPITLSVPEYDWERVNEKVNEGPAVLQQNGKIYVVYSAAATGDEYCMGMLTVDDDADLMDLRNWTKCAYPVLETNDLAEQYGPGHNSFTVDEDGNVILVYHARDEKCHKDQCDYASSDPLYDPCRNAMLAYARYDGDGTPVFTSTDAKELADVDVSDLRITCQVNGENQEYTPIASYSLLEDGTDSVGDTKGSLAGDSISYDHGLIINGGTSKNKQNYLDISNNTALLEKLQNTDKLTIQAWVRNDVSGNAHSTVFTLGSDNSNWFAFNTLNWSNARASFKINENEVSGIKYDTTGNKSSILDEWYPVTIVLEDASDESQSKTKITYYMDGEYVTDLTTNASIGQMGDLSYLYIGAGQDTNYYDFSGGIKNVEFFDTAMTKSGVLNYCLPNMLKEKILGENKYLDAIQTDLTLPDTLKSRALTWTSSNESVISAEGKVTLPSEDLGEVPVTMTASYLLNGDTVEIPELDDIRGNIYLPEAGENGSTITWESSDTDVISDQDNGKFKAGVVNRKSEDTKVTLTATLTYDKISDTKKFKAKVKAAIGKQNFTKYLFAYFTGDGGAQTEQIYFSTSKDGLYWDQMNDGNPVLK
ncbi:MAG: family 43 glycosylhydrolase, partial [Lachnospiraceae bacterium]|nr:family 43 glycosylhydrolase [Lachnospiraceae bacterium]